MPREVIQTGTPANPSASSRAVLPRSDGWYDRDSTGSEKKLSDKGDTSNVPSYAMPASGALGGRYDQLRGIYNYKSSNTRILEQGLSRAMVPGGGQSTHLIIGDSVSAGCISFIGTASFDRLRAWPLAMRDQLRVMGIPANGTGLIRHIDGTASLLDTRWTYTGTWTNSVSCTQSTVAASTATLVPDRSGTVFDYWYYDSAGGTFTISVDGATSGTGFATITASGAAGWKYVRLTGLTIIANVSTIKITLTVVGAAGIISSGGDVWTPNGGLLIENAAQSGSTASGTGTSAWVDTSSGTAPGLVYNDVGGRRRTVTNASSTSGSSTLTSATGAFTSNDIGKSIDELSLGAGGRMFPDNCYIGAILSSTTVTMYQGVGANAGPVNAYATLSSQSISIGREPACVHIALGLNDMGTLAASDATITAAITTIRNRYPNSDCILHLTHEFAPSYVTAARQLTFQKAMYALADTLDVPLYDWRDRVGTFANGAANGVYGDSAVHLTPATEADLGAQIAFIMGGGSGRQQAGTPVLDDDVVPKAYIDRRKTKTAGATATTTTESVVLRLPIPAGGLVVGDAFRYALAYKPALATATTVRIRVGTTGTTSDAAVVTMSATAAATSAAMRYAEGQVGVQAVGASATILGTGTETVGAVTASGVATATSGTFDSTKVNYVTVTIQNSVSTTTTVYSGSLEWV
jgi:hypothetical protein